MVGDGQELGAIDAWYGRGAGRHAERPLLIGSVKSNMGHCEGASGLAGQPPARCCVDTAASVLLHVLASCLKSNQSFCRQQYLHAWAARNVNVCPAKHVLEHSLIVLNPPHFCLQVLSSFVSPMSMAACQGIFTMMSPILAAAAFMTGR